MRIVLITVIKVVVFMNLAFAAINAGIALHDGSPTNAVVALLGLGGALFLGWIAKDIT